MYMGLGLQRQIKYKARVSFEELKIQCRIHSCKQFQYFAMKSGVIYERVS